METYLTVWKESDVSDFVNEVFGVFSSHQVNKSTWKSIFKKVSKFSGFILLKMVLIFKEKQSAKKSSEKLPTPTSLSKEEIAEDDNLKELVVPETPSSPQVARLSNILAKWDLSRKGDLGDFNIFPVVRKRS